MGGVAGHLTHVYEDLELSFRKLKQILSDASNGKLVGSEKLDGFGVYLSFRDGNAVAARNKGDILSGGLDAKKMVAREFAGGDKVKKVYVRALDSFTKAINQLSPDTQQKLFQNGTIYYNTEILGPSVKNVINYDKDILSIHRSNHKQLVDGEIQPFDESSLSSFLDKIINKMEEKDSGEDFSVRRSAIIKLKGLSEKQDLLIAKAKIDKLLASSKLKDQNTIEDYVRTHLNSAIEEKLPEFSREIKKNIIDNVIHGEKLLIPAGTSRDTRGRISSFRKEASVLMKNSLFPLEEIVTDFSVAMLQGLESTFIVDSKKEVMRLRAEVAKAIKAIQTSGNKEAVDILVKQLKKLKSDENISTPAEGFVFSYGDKVYKFTGAFAPVNQLLGLFKYGRGKATVDTIKELEEQGFTPQIIAAVPGGFKPPHAGHFALVEQFAKMPEVQKVFIFISPKERIGHTDTSSKTITAEMSRQLWQLYTHNDPKFVIKITEKSPILSVYNLVEELKPGDTLLLGQSEKESTDQNSRFGSIQKYIDKNHLGVIVKPITTPLFAGKVSGTEVREIIAKGDKKTFFSVLPKHLNQKEKEQAWSIVNKKNLYEILYHMIKEEKKKSQIEEISAAGMGAVEGASNIGKKDKKDMISRKEFVEELKLREQIKKILEDINHKEKVVKEQHLKEENMLRKQIQKLLFEGVLFEETEVDPHDSTGINVLEELLKKIVPILEVDYKTLTTSEEQRQSFRAHIINAIQNVLIPSRVTPSDLDAEAAPEDETESLKEKSQAIIKGASDAVSPGSLNEENINIEVGDEEQDIDTTSSVDEPTPEDAFIDIKDKQKKKEKDIFTIKDMDMTGRNLALKSFDKIEKNIIDSYSLLSDEEDKNLFYSYLLANLKLYADKWEDELSASVEEPSNQEYEQGKEAQTSEVDTNFSDEEPEI